MSTEPRIAAGTVRPRPKSPAQAYGHVLARVLGAVAITAAFSAVVFAPRLEAAFLRRAMVPENLDVALSNLWGVNVRGPLLGDFLEFVVTRALSPAVTWPLIAAGVLALVLEYRRQTAGE